MDPGETLMMLPLFRRPLFRKIAGTLGSLWKDVMSIPNPGPNRNPLTLLVCTGKRMSEQQSLE